METDGFIRIERITMFNKIKEFHEKFGLEYNGDPRQLSAEMQKFRCKFLLEEITEYLMATMDGDIVEQLDALVDIVYVALGTAYLQGFDFNEAFRRVHEQNMKKVRVEKPSDSKRGTSFDVVKPPGWTHASLVDLCMPTDRAIVHNEYVHKSCINCGKYNMCNKEERNFRIHYNKLQEPIPLSEIPLEKRFCDDWRNANG